MIFQVAKDGNCMFHSIWCQLGFNDDGESTGPETSTQGRTYSATMIRRQSVMFMAQILDVSIQIGVTSTFVCSIVRSHPTAVRSYCAWYVLLQEGYPEIDEAVTNELMGLYGLDDGGGDPGPFTLKEYMM